MRRGKFHTQTRTHHTNAWFIAAVLVFMISYHFVLPDTICNEAIEVAIHVETYTVCLCGFVFTSKASRPEYTCIMSIYSIFEAMI